MGGGVPASVIESEYARFESAGAEAMFTYGFDPLGRRIVKINEITTEGDRFPYRAPNAAPAAGQ